jgi:hypothetical protein
MTKKIREKRDYEWISFIFVCLFRFGIIVGFFTWGIVDPFKHQKVVDGVGTLRYGILQTRTFFGSILIWWLIGAVAFALFHFASWYLFDYHQNIEGFFPVIATVLTFIAISGTLVWSIADPATTQTVIGGVVRYGVMHTKTIIGAMVIWWTIGIIGSSILHFLLRILAWFIGVGIY